MKHLRLFETEAAFDVAKENLPEPWVAITEDDNSVWHSTEGGTGGNVPIFNRGILVTYDITDASEPTTLFQTYGSQAYLTEMSIDGGEFVTPTNTYRFDSIGEHTVEYKVDNTFVTNSPLFYNQSEIVKAEVGDDVTDLWFMGFYGCGIKEVVLNNNGVCNDINSTNPPFHTSTLTSVTIGNNVTSIGKYAFNGCDSLTSVTIPDSVTSIGDYAFQNCYGLTSVIIGNSVTSIGNYAFNGCNSLTSINIPDSVTNIGNYAFYGCRSLTSVTIPNSVTTIGSYTFQGCTSLTSVTMSNSVTGIGDRTFQGCDSLTSVTIPDSVTSIGNYAFQGCTSLTSVTYSGTIEQWNAITKGNNWNASVPATSVTCSDGTTAL